MRIRSKKISLFYYEDESLLSTGRFISGTLRRTKKKKKKHHYNDYDFC